MIKIPRCKLFITFFLLVVFQQLWALPLLGGEDTVIPGVTFQGQALGGKNRREVYAVLQEANERLQKQAVILNLYEVNEIISSNYGEMGVAIETKKTWQEVISLGRGGRWWENLWQRWKVRRKGFEVGLHLEIDKEKAAKKLQELTEAWREVPLDAELIVHADDKIEIKPHKCGREINTQEALLALEKLVAAKPGGKIELVLAFSMVQPARLKSDIVAYRINGLVSRFTTMFNASRTGRTNNIVLAAKALDGFLLAPGEVFSFNGTVGPRTKEAGYDEADIILQRELVPGVGGGVCQVSTTLYNTVLRAGLEIVERTPHSLIIPYVEPGLDATVSYDHLDFKFRNNTTGHVLLKTAVYQGSLTIKLFGLTPKGRQVVIKSIKEKEIPPNTVYKRDPLLPKGRFVLEKEGQPGFVYRVERLVYTEKKELIKKEVVSRDYYPPLERVIRTHPGSALLSY